MNKQKPRPSTVLNGRDHFLFRFLHQAPYLTAPHLCQHDKIFRLSLVDVLLPLLVLLDSAHRDTGQFGKLATDELDSPKCRLTLENKLLTELAKIHRIVKLTVRNRTIYEILCKRKIAVIDTIANDRVAVLVINGKIGKQILVHHQEC